MAKTSTKPKSAKTTENAAKKATTAKSETPKESAAKKKPGPKKTTSTASEKGSTEKAAPKKAAASRTTDPAAALAKQCQEAAAKFDKMEDGKYAEIKEKLEWCLGSYNYDKNPAGLADYARQALDKLKEARQEKPRQVSQKFVDDLEKALSKF